jgi:enoyl-[acyl-carrier-protein] reductase (NADH)
VSCSDDLSAETGRETAAAAVAPLYEYLGGPLNTYLVGQVIYADGGSDVLLRGEEVP